MMCDECPLWQDRLPLIGGGKVGRCAVTQDDTLDSHQCDVTLSTLSEFYDAVRRVLATRELKEA